jgi:hypothetical protein
LAIGIDPAFELEHSLAADSQLFRTTSDEFFEANDVRGIFGGLPVDLAFIDGMHHFEFALRDFMHLETYAGPDSTILVHDCYPIDEQTATRERTTTKWSGDIWKLVLCLKEYRPDLQVSVVDVRPTGLGVIRRLDGTSTTLADKYEEICERYVPLSYSVLDSDKDHKLNLIPDDWPQVRALLPDKPFRRPKAESPEGHGPQWRRKAARLWHAARTGAKG